MNSDFFPPLPGMLQREKSSRSLAGLSRERLGVGTAPEPPLPLDTLESIPQLVAELTRAVTALEQSEDTGSSDGARSEEEKARWGEAELQRVETLRSVSIRQLVTRMRNVIFPPEERGSEGGGGSGAPGFGASGPQGASARIVALVNELVAQETFPALLLHFTDLLFETRKMVASVWVYLLRPDLELDFKDYLSKHHQIVSQLIDCYSHETSALPAGIMLRELVRQNEVMHRVLLVGSQGGLSLPFVKLLGCLSNAQFDIASDAFETFSTVLTQNRRVVLSVLNPGCEDMACKAR